MHAVGYNQRLLGSPMNECVCCLLQEKIWHLGIDPKMGETLSFPFEKLYVRLARGHVPYEPVTILVGA